MIKLFLMLFLSVALPSCHKTSPVDPEVKVPRYTKDLTFTSAILGTKVKYSVLLPENYAKNTSTSYPVVYLLHGLGDDNNSWNDNYLSIATLVEELEADSTIAPMIYVLPQGYDYYYCNYYDNSVRYMDMFTDELVPYIDKTYRTKADASHRAVAGYSMGGFGAMILPTLHPELFSVSVPLSMSFRTDYQYETESASGWNNQWGRIFGGSGLSGAARLTEYYKEHCPFYIFNAASVSKLSSVHYFLDCGDDEENLSQSNDSLHILLRSIGLPHEYRVRNGAHTSQYWRSGMREALPFIQDCFDGKDYPSSEETAASGTFIGSVETKNVGEATIRIYLPASYASSSDSLSSVYFMYSGLDVTAVDKAAGIMKFGSSSKSYMMVACDAEALEKAGVSVNRVMSFVESTYRVRKSADNRTAIGFGYGGKLLYSASAASYSFKSVFLFDGALGDAVAEPCRQTFYFIDIADMGTNYRAADDLYFKCRKAGVGHEYRVRNGVAGSPYFFNALSLLYATITDTIK